MTEGSEGVDVGVSGGNDPWADSKENAEVRGPEEAQGWACSRSELGRRSGARRSGHFDQVKHLVSPLSALGRALGEGGGIPESSSKMDWGTRPAVTISEGVFYKVSRWGSCYGLRLWPNLVFRRSRWLPWRRDCGEGQMAVGHQPGSRGEARALGWGPGASSFQ